MTEPRKPIIDHYKWLDLYLDVFFQQCGLPPGAHVGSASAHGDKCSQYRENWLQNGIPFPHGAALYLLTYERPYSLEARQTPNGWVPPGDWVVTNYLRFQPMLPPVDETDRRLWLFGIGPVEVPKRLEKAVKGKHQSASIGFTAGVNVLGQGEGK